MFVKHVCPDEEGILRVKDSKYILPSLSKAQEHRFLMDSWNISLDGVDKRERAIRSTDLFVEYCSYITETLQRIRALIFEMIILMCIPFILAIIW